MKFLTENCFNEAKEYIKSLEVIYTAYIFNKKYLRGITPYFPKWDSQPHITVKFHPTEDEFLNDIGVLPYETKASAIGYGLTETNEGIFVYVPDIIRKKTTTGIPHITVSHCGKPQNTIYAVENSVPFFGGYGVKRKNNLGTIQDIRNGEIVDQVKLPNPNLDTIWITPYAYTKRGWISFNEISKTLKEIKSNNKFEQEVVAQLKAEKAKEEAEKERLLIEEYTKEAQDILDKFPKYKENLPRFTEENKKRKEILNNAEAFAYGEDIFSSLLYAEDAAEDDYCNCRVIHEIMAVINGKKVEIPSRHNINLLIDICGQDKYNFVRNYLKNHLSEDDYNLIIKNDNRKFVK